MRRFAALSAILALAGCGGEGTLDRGEVVGCLGADGITAEPRGDPAHETEVLVFEIQPAPVTRGFLIFVADGEQATSLAADIEAEARAQRSEAQLLVVRNVIVQFFTEGPPPTRDEQRIRACLETE